MTEKRGEFLKRLREGVEGNDSVRPSGNPHQNIKYEPKPQSYQMRSKIKK